ncbi:thiol peroxidase [Wenyingzhuangia sp. 2_MG-2023]|uniref:thiol peroxidase n=1 Tax=Wenyingzhuangia sp. 2_MG-2023 TaxID=3062639 RepID=UPI0026E362CF|nr:thiol peroxidase [Wenyingzhuangia sp. 2_MG-2023]MDO6737327.1 thiol peroxidase [Wenyingzhuangia sp. 2_MG-2023]MDO6803088.1 thiol peroxidase [Wenyingzhuangia sp. 1_MG-2023]
MANITLKGNPIETIGDLPKIGTKAPEFTLTNTDLSEVKSTDLLGSNLILNIFPSVDTSTCATSIRKFNQKAASLDNTKVLCISKDLPFAHKRFCGAEGIENVLSLSDISGDFGKNYELTFANGPLKGLLSRAIVVVDTEGNVVYTEQVSETADEPDYGSALDAL